MKETTAGRMGGYKENYNPLTRDAMNDYPSEQISDPNYFEFSEKEKEKRAEMGGIAGQALPHPDHFANPYMDLDDNQAAFGDMYALLSRASDLKSH
jgi:hypothetical protein